MKNRAVKTVLAVSMAAAVVMGTHRRQPQVQAAGTESAGAESSAELIPVPKEMSADGTELTVDRFREYRRSRGSGCRCGQRSQRVTRCEWNHGKRAGG